MKQLLFAAHPYALLIFGFGLGMFCHFVMDAIAKRIQNRKAGFIVEHYKGKAK